ncbi:hypothetical protein DV737_g4345, partial [Chaetothyriales sp. CBS 132003]
MDKETNPGSSIINQPEPAVLGAPGGTVPNQGDLATHGHNASAQRDVDANPDLVLHYSHEHQHAHLHHGRKTSIAKDKEEHVAYATGGDEPRRELLESSSQDYTTHKLRVADQDKPEFGVQDSEMGVISPTRLSEVEGDGKKGRVSRFYRKYRIFFHLAIWLLFTAWWIVGLIYHRHDSLGWLKPFLVYLAITLRLIFFHIPVSVVKKPMAFVWTNTIMRIYNMIPKKLHQPLAAAGTVVVMLLGTFIPEESQDNTRENRAVSFFGLIVMIALLYATSRDRKRIQWHTVIGGMLAQFVIALFVLRTQAGYDIFSFISFLARQLLDFAQEGTEFLTTAEVAQLSWFLIGVIPPIIFFVALVQLLYHSGLLQWFIVKFATFFYWSLRVSGAEAVVAAATPFIGQGESAMLIRPFVPHLTLAEIHQVMTCGFATIAGSVLVAYIGLGLNPQALVSSCIMSIPASLAVSKLRYPETEETITSGRVVVPDDEDHKASNSLHAFANGAWLGIKIAGMIVATLLCIIAFVGLTNGLLGWWGRFFNIEDPRLTLQLILGYVCYPVAFLLGVPRQDLRKVGEVIGVKVILNEFVAFTTLSSAENADLSPRSLLIATYACCGFGNLGSLGTQIGVLSQIAPNRAGDVSKVALSALFSGVISTLSSAAVAGLVVTTQTV